LKRDRLTAFQFTHVTAGLQLEIWVRAALQGVPVIQTFKALPGFHYTLWNQEEGIYLQYL